MQHRYTDQLYITANTVCTDLHGMLANFYNMLYYIPLNYANNSFNRLLLTTEWEY